MITLLFFKQFSSLLHMICPFCFRKLSATLHYTWLLLNISSVFFMPYKFFYYSLQIFHCFFTKFTSFHFFINVYLSFYKTFLSLVSLFNIKLLKSEHLCLTSHFSLPMYILLRFVFRIGLCFIK